MKKIFAIFTALCIVVLIFGSCFSSWDGEPGEGTISINLGGGTPAQRSAITEDAKVYKITLTSAAEEKNTFTDSSNTVIKVSPGSWNISIAAYRNEQDKQDEKPFAEGRTVEPVMVIAGANSDATITLKLIVVKPPDLWPAEAQWAEYSLTNGLTRPQPEQTTTAYVVDGWDSFNINAQARNDINSLPDTMSSSINNKDFFMVKLAFLDIEKDAKDGIYRDDLYNQIEKNNKFEKTANIDWDSSSPERWDIFQKSTTVVNLYMNYAGNYLIILAVKEYSWQKIKWEQYGIVDMEQPEEATVVYVTYKPDEANKSNSKLQTDYGLRPFSNTGFPEFFAVVFLDKDGSIYDQLEEQIESKFPSSSKTDTNGGIRILITEGAYTRAIDLFKPTDNEYKDYTIFTVRQGNKTSTTNWW